MVNAAELRIGNYILLKKPGEEPRMYDVTAHDICEIDDDEDNGDEFVPMTEELFEKCGFVQIGYQQYTSNDSYFFTFHKVGYFGWYTEDFNFPLRIKYLHQLQNLYFLITGTELKFEQKPA